jgi:hypothetical protein
MMRGKAVFLWGESDMMWTQGVIELYRWRRQRKLLAAQAAQLIAETVQFLAQADQLTRPAEPPRPGDPPRFN